MAAVAIARRLATILWAMWRRNVAYDPAHVAELSADGIEQRAEVVASQAASMRRAATKTKQRKAALSRRERRMAPAAARLRNERRDHHRRKPKTRQSALERVEIGAANRWGR